MSQYRNENCFIAGTRDLEWRARFAFTSPSPWGTRRRSSSPPRRSSRVARYVQLFIPICRTSLTCTVSGQYQILKSLFDNHTFLFLKNKYLSKRSKCFHKKIWIFHSVENIYWKLTCLVEIWITWSQKELLKPQFQVSSKYIRKGNNKFKVPFL